MALFRSNPILSWEITAVGRRQRYFWARAFYCVVLLFMLWSVYQGMYAYTVLGTSAVRQFQLFGERFFWSFSYTQLSMVLLLTPAYVATSVAVEKQRKTIDYLFATDLSNAEIILGKWAARSLNIAVLILSAMPIVSASMFFGSIDPQQVLSIMRINLLCVISTAALSILVSIYSRDARVAITQSYMFLVLLLLSPTLVWALQSLVEATIGGPAPIFSEILGAVGDWLVFCQPFFFMSQTLRAGSYLELFSLDVTAMALVHLLFAACCLAIAVFRVRKFHLRDEGKAELKRTKDRKTLTVGRRPMLWKEWRFDHERGRRWVSILVQFLVWGGFYGMFCFFLANQANTRFSEELNVFLRIAGTLVLLLALLRTAVRAAGGIGAERDRDTWLSLLATPLSEEDIIYAKIAGSLKPLLQCCLALMPAWVVAMMLGAMSPIALPLLLIEAAAYGFFVAAMGVHQSLVRKTTTAALGATLTIGVLMCGVVQLFGGCVFAMLQTTGLDQQVIIQAVLLSIPWIVIGGSAFHPGELKSFNEPEIVIIATLFVLGNAVVGLILAGRAVDQFGPVTGRTRATLTVRHLIPPRRPAAPAAGGAATSPTPTA